MRPRIIPVIDLLRGQVVRGVAGKRNEYRPLVSKWTTSTRPDDVANALIDRYRPQEIYAADLDAIMGNGTQRSALRGLAALATPVWVDAGVRSADRAEELVQWGFQSVICASETLPDPRTLEAIVGRIGAERLVFSLDLKNGNLLGSGALWQPENDLFNILDIVVALGIERLIVLDLAYIGVNQGAGTESLCQAIATTYPGIEVITGGGIRGAADLERLQDCGVRGALAASALHDGRIDPAGFGQ